MKEILIPVISMIIVWKIIIGIILHRGNKHWKNETPEKLLKFSLHGANNGPDSNEMTIFALAQIYAYYGMYDLALAQINEIDWTLKPNRLKSFERRFHAIVQFIQYQNFSYGLELAYESKRLGKFNFGKESYHIINKVGELLNGKIDENNIYFLEKKFKRNKYVVMKLLMAWALANALFSLGKLDESEKYLDYCIETAPGCHPFQKIFIKTNL